ncbi:hypothetical protein [uncultured Alistipes sp.]|uniref:hypothetical protein n=1 Tax=uncultured Alistipes sp. TaxID=538949 RepID=UPI00261026FC|nr:hypothetical protein [uncultured Alistipes sp.]
MKEQTLKEQTLKELYMTLDHNAQANIIRFFSAKLLVVPTTAIYYLRGYRKLPEKKRPILAGYVKKNYGVKLKFS